jgi:hypothetical protein
LVDVGDQSIRSVIIVWINRPIGRSYIGGQQDGNTAPTPIDPTQPHQPTTHLPAINQPTTAQIAIPRPLPHLHELGEVLGHVEVDEAHRPAADLLPRAHAHLGALDRRERSAAQLVVDVPPAQVVQHDHVVALLREVQRRRPSAKAVVCGIVDVGGRRTDGRGGVRRSRRRSRSRASKQVGGRGTHAPSAHSTTHIHTR